MPTKRLPSSPPRHLCRSPGPGPSVSSLSCPKPSLFWVMKPTLAHTTALTASYTPVSPTDTAGTHSHFTHAQAQPHQSTALLRVVVNHPLAAVEAPQPLLLSAPLNACCAPPHDSPPKEHWCSQRAPGMRFCNLSHLTKGSCDWERRKLDARARVAKFCDILRLDPRGLPAADSNTETGLRSEFGPNVPRASPWTGTDGRYPFDRCGGPGRRRESQSCTVGARPQA